MCGIAGIFSFDQTAPNASRSELLAIRDYMENRGPDGKGEWFSSDSRVALGHRRLSIIDLSNRSAQPMVSENHNLILTFNGEIYNYRELKSSLEAKGYIFRTESDTEVLLHLYAEKRESMLDDLRGMFAFAIWDDRYKELFLARDPFGIKPLYYANNGKIFRFASQVKALLAGGQIDKEPEPAGHAGFFLWGSVPDPWTLYKGIHSLPAGHFLKVNKSGASRPVSYCQISDILRTALDNPAKGTKSDALEAITTSVNDSVKAHHVADVPVGLFLSAGLDSSIITALSCTGREQLRTLTLSFNEYSGTEHDEAPIAEELANLFSTKHTTVSIGREEFQEEYKKLINAMDQPSIDGVNTWFVTRAASHQGMKVALSGVGGDELFGSYPSFRDVPKLEAMASPLSRLPGVARILRQISRPILTLTTSPKFAGLFEYGATTGGAYLLRRGLYMHWELSDLLDPELAKQGWQELCSFDQLNRIIPPHNKTNEQIVKRSMKSAQKRMSVSALEMSCYMRNQLLRDTDWASMAHSLEVRTPFVDKVMLQSIAPWLVAYPDLMKPDIAEAIVPSLPDKVLNKPKTGFSIPVREWLMERPHSTLDRGLRGWAKHIHRSFVGEMA